MSGDNNNRKPTREETAIGAWEEKERARELREDTILRRIIDRDDRDAALYRKQLDNDPAEREWLRLAHD